MRFKIITPLKAFPLASSTLLPFAWGKAATARMQEVEQRRERLPRIGVIEGCMPLKSTPIPTFPLAGGRSSAFCGACSIAGGRESPWVWGSAVRLYKVAALKNPENISKLFLPPARGKVRMGVVKNSGTLPNLTPIRQLLLRCSNFRHTWRSPAFPLAGGRSFRARLFSKSRCATIFSASVPT